MKKLSQYLAAPSLPQMNKDYLISENDIKVGGGVFVRILPYDKAAEGDYITLLWDGMSVGEFFLSDPADDFPLIKIISSGVEIGKHEVYYSVQDKAGNELNSSIVTLTIAEGQPDVIYRAPVFNDADNGILTQSSIEESNGTDITVLPYDNMSLNDVVTLFLVGYDEQDLPLRTDVEANGVTIDNLSDGVIFHIDASYFTGLSKGTVSAYYQVRNKSNILGLSAEARVSISAEITPSELDMIITQGAAEYDPKAIDVVPFNQGVIKGKPGVAVTVSLVGANAVFNDSESRIHTAILDEDGKTAFKIRSSLIGECTVVAFETNHPEVTVTRQTLFGPYKEGTGKLKYINITTGAPADGVTPCSVYLKTLPSLRNYITKVRVFVDGGATIDGYYTNTADVLLNSDNSAEINIVNTKSGMVNVELSLPEASGSSNKLKTSFIDF